MTMWDYCFEGDVIARIRRPDDDPPYIGMPIYMAGRSGKLAPVEDFIVSGIEAKRLVLELSA